MENLITVIIFLIIFFSVINQIKKSQPGGKNEGLVARINTYLTDLQRKLEQQTGTKSSDGFEWDRLIDEEELVHTREDSLNDLVLPEKKQPPKPPTPARRKTDRPQKSRSEKRPTTEIKCRSGRSSRRWAMVETAKNRARLRQAIVWSEILGPPVGLKDPRGNRR